MKIKSIRKIHYAGDVKNLSVEDNHNYIAGGIVVSNCKATSLKNISAWCTSAAHRIGMSGTYPDAGNADYLTVVGALGPIKKYITYQEMADKGYIARLKIFSVILDYDQEFRMRIKNECYKDYPGEGDLIHNHPGRNMFISKLVNNLDKNVLILFTKIEKHGLVLKKHLEQHCKEKSIIYIDGDTPTMERERFRRIAEERNDLVILASYGTFSTGISIKNIHHVIFASGYKSKYKVLQSIGRGLRKMKDKFVIHLYDLIDDCKTKKKGEPAYINYSLQHYDERKILYENNNFENKEMRYPIK